MRGLKNRGQAKILRRTNQLYFCFLRLHPSGDVMASWGSCSVDPWWMNTAKYVVLPPPCACYSSPPTLIHQDLLHTYDKFVGPLPDQEAEGAKALHSLFPMILDSKEVIAKAVAAGLEFPSSTLGDAFRWLCEFHAVKAAHCTNGGGETAEVDEGKLDTAKSIDETPKVARKAAAWQAAYASGFEERYACGGYEHEAAYDAYLTGCCFIAAATLGLGTSVEEMKNLKPGNEVPSSLGTVVNVMPLYRVVRTHPTTFLPVYAE